MRTLKLIPLMSIVMLLISCGQSREENTETTGETTAETQEFQDHEEARGEWLDAWNSNDVQRIESLAASDAVLVLNGREVPADSISGFYQGAGSVMKDLDMRALKKGATDNIAYETGTFSHTYNTNDAGQYGGSYTFIWERADDETEWKVKAMNISDTRYFQEEN